MEADATQQSVRRLSEFKDSPEGVNALKAIELAGTGELAPTAEMVLELLVTRGISIGLEIGAQALLPVGAMIEELRADIKKMLEVPDPAPAKDTFSPTELAERWGKSVVSVRRWISEGKLHFFFKVGHDWIAKREDVVKFENRSKIKPEKNVRPKT